MWQRTQNNVHHSADFIELLPSTQNNGRSIVRVYVAEI